MEKHACKLCFRRFANGRALGGHMRSHVAAASPPSPSLSPASSSSSEDASEEEAAGLGYVLRENPKKSFKLVDPEFDAGAGSSIVVQDRESETESPRGDNRRRSKRNRGAEPEQPGSSISDATTEEDVALSLMMLSRDSWSRSEPSDSSDDDERVSPAARSSRRSRFQCGTCNKVFRSYQALGGHRASHKKESKDSAKQSKPSSSIPNPHQIHEATESSEANADRIHQCPICFRVFSSGQALGGHKRSHLTTTAAASASPLPQYSLPLPPPPRPRPPPPPPTPKLIDSFIDLNLPAPIDDDIELSAVSDPDFSRR